MFNPIKALVNLFKQEKTEQADTQKEKIEEGVTPIYRSVLEEYIDSLFDLKAEDYEFNPMVLAANENISKLIEMIKETSKDDSMTFKEVDLNIFAGLIGKNYLLCKYLQMVFDISEREILLTLVIFMLEEVSVNKTGQFKVSDSPKEILALADELSNVSNAKSAFDSLMQGKVKNVADLILSKMFNMPATLLIYDDSLCEGDMGYDKYVREHLLTYFGPIPSMIVECCGNNVQLGAMFISKIRKANVLLFKGTGELVKDPKHFPKQLELREDLRVVFNADVGFASDTTLLPKDCAITLHSDIVITGVSSKLSRYAENNNMNLYAPFSIYIKHPSSKVNSPTQPSERNKRFYEALPNDEFLMSLDAIKNLLVSLIECSDKSLENGELGIELNQRLWYNNYLERNDLDEDDKWNVISNKVITACADLKTPIRTHIEAALEGFRYVVDLNFLQTLVQTLDLSAFYFKYYAGVKEAKLTGEFIADVMSKLLIHTLTINAEALKHGIDKTKLDNILDKLLAVSHLYKSSKKRRPTKLKSTFDIVDNENSDTITYSLDYINTDIDINKFIDVVKSTGRKPFAILHGESGSGKSEFVKRVGEMLNRKVLTIKTTDYLKRYVGEGEERVSDLFEEARKDNSIILVDEADSLVTARSSGSSEFTKYKDDMTNHLLTELDKRGVMVFMTTNYIDNIDTAVLRRSNLKIKFDTLTNESKVKIFKEICKKSDIKIPRKMDISSVLGKIPLTVGIFQSTLDRLPYESNIDANKVINMLQLESKKVINETSKIGF